MEQRSEDSAGREVIWSAGGVTLSDDIDALDDHDGLGSLG
jgi:hypothetical protein